MRALKIFQKVYDVALTQSETGNAFAEDVIRYLRLLIDAGKLSDARKIIQEVDDGGLNETDDRFIIQYDLERLDFSARRKNSNWRRHGFKRLLSEAKNSETR